MCIIMICNFYEMLKKSSIGATNKEGFIEALQNFFQWNNEMNTTLLDALIKE